MRRIHSLSESRERITELSRKNGWEDGRRREKVRQMLACQAQFLCLFWHSSEIFISKSKVQGEIDCSISAFRISLLNKTWGGNCRESLCQRKRLHSWSWLHILCFSYFISKNFFLFFTPCSLHASGLHVYTCLFNIERQRKHSHLVVSFYMNGLSH